MTTSGRRGLVQQSGAQLWAKARTWVVMRRAAFAIMEAGAMRAERRRIDECVVHGIVEDWEA